jgi:hypothetical protein
LLNTEEKKAFMTLIHRETEMALLFTELTRQPAMGMLKGHQTKFTVTDLAAH